MRVLVLTRNRDPALYDLNNLNTLDVFTITPPSATSMAWPVSAENSLVLRKIL